MKKGMSAMGLAILIAILITVITVILIYMTSTEYGPQLLEGMKNFICGLPGFC